jgi:ABC-type Fe3+-hydroxamate transport system substrate-binding protein
MIRLVDDMGRQLTIPRPPQRVVSLVPSDTYSVARLGAASRLVGRTDYCVEPPELAGQVVALGGTKNPRLDELLALEPDLVIANQEENSRGDLEKLERAGLTILISFPKRVAEGIAHLARLARVLGVEREPAARELVRQGYAMLQRAGTDGADGADGASSAAPLRAFVPIWMDPLMTINGDTYISDMLALCGAENVFADRERRYPLAADLGIARALPYGKIEGRDTRYPRVTLEEVASRAPDVVLLPDEPHPFTEQDAAVFREAGLPASGADGVVFCSGRDLCWSGARAIEGYAAVRGLISGLAARGRSAT